MKDVTLLTRLIRDLFPDGGGEFKPIAFYQKELDRIKVIAADCSITEVSVGNNLVLFERNHTEDGELTYVGFSIEGARFFCKANGLPYRGKVNISHILARMSEIDPKSMPAILDIALHTLLEHNIDEVEFPE